VLPGAFASAAGRDERGSRSAVDVIIQALVMGIVQGLTEFLPVSSSGHLIVVPFFAGWDDAFINSLAFSVMLHLGTLVALLVYFRADWLRLVPAGLAALRDRSFRGDEDRRLAWLLVASTIPAAILGLVFGDLIEDSFRSVGLVAVTLVLGGLILLVADRFGAKSRAIEDVTFPIAIGIGAAQALALVPGISRSGISISAGRLVGMDRETAARFAFLMATPITAGAGLFEARKLLAGESGLRFDTLPLVVGMVASLVSGLLAIHFMLSFLRRQSLDVFVWYRFALAAIVLIAWLAR
jgi:undecaprenyl-diphosphatase